MALLFLFLSSIGMTFLYFQARKANDEARGALAESQVKAKETQLAKEAESRALVEVQNKEQQLRKTLSQTDFRYGTELLASGENRKALAYLARALRTEPSFLAPAHAIVSTLRDRPLQLSPTIILRQKSPILSYLVSPAEEFIAAQSSEGEISLWSTRTWELKWNSGNEPFHLFRFTPTGDRLMLLSRDGVIRSIRLDPPDFREDFLLQGSNFEKIKVHPDRDGRLPLMALDLDKQLKVLTDFDREPLEIPAPGGQASRIGRYNIRPGDSRIFIQSEDRLVGIWNLHKMAWTGEMLSVPLGPIDIQGCTRGGSGVEMPNGKALRADRGAV